MKNNMFRDGRVHVCERMCDTCIFRPGNKMHLEQGRVQEMVAGATEAESSVICHDTLSGDNSACRGFFDLHKTAPLKIAERLDLITYTKGKGDNVKG